jgi:hypothetical protein
VYKLRRVFEALIRVCLSGKQVKRPEETGHKRWRPKEERTEASGWHWGWKTIVEIVEVEGRKGQLSTVAGRHDVSV